MGVGFLSSFFFSLFLMVVARESGAAWEYATWALTEPNEQRKKKSDGVDGCFSFFVVCLLAFIELVVQRSSSFSFLSRFPLTDFVLFFGANIYKKNAVGSD